MLDFSHFTEVLITLPAGQSQWEDVLAEERVWQSARRGLSQKNCACWVYRPKSLQKYGPLSLLSRSSSSLGTLHSTTIPAQRTRRSSGVCRSPIRTTINLTFTTARRLRSSL